MSYVSPTLMPDGVTKLVDAAREYATFAHAGLFRRDGVTPYITHPARVAELLAGESDEVIAVAWLHDVIEDTGRTEGDLIDAGFPVEVVQSVVWLSKRGGQDYDTYLLDVARFPIPRKVKAADMIANLGDAPSPKQTARYTKGLIFLLNRSH